MRNIIRFVLFLIYTVAIFFIKDIKILGIIFALNCIVAVLVRVNIKKFFGDLKIILPFLILTFIFNMFFLFICLILLTNSKRIKEKNINENKNDKNKYKY